MSSNELCAATWEPRSEFFTEYAGLHHCALPAGHGGPHVEVVHGWRWLGGHLDDPGRTETEQ